MAAPADAVVLKRAAHAVVGHGAMLEPDAAAFAEARGEEGAQLSGAAVGGVRADGLAEVSVPREGGNYRLSVAGSQRGVVAADNITQVNGLRLENRRPDVPPSVDWPLAAVGAEHDRPVVGTVGNDCHRPRLFRPVIGHMR